MNGGINRMMASVMRLLFSWTIAYLKPSFLSDYGKLSKALSQQGFHPAICAHPSIVFGVRSSENKSRFCFGVLSCFLKRCIRIGLLTNENGHRLMLKLGIQPFWGNTINYWFIDQNAPVVPYVVPDDPKPRGRVVVYTALTGDYDKVNEILLKEEGVDYFLFTNNPSVRSKTWNVISVNSDLDNVLLSREIKMMPHKYLDEDYEVSVYIDANAVIYGELTQLTRYLGNGKVLAVSRHSVRKTVREEIDACVKLGKADGPLAESQYNRYREEGFMDDKALLECSVLVRNHHDETLQLLMTMWFDEFKNGIRRDQLSLLPCISRLNYQDYVVMEGSTWHNQFFRLVNHK